MKNVHLRLPGLLIKVIAGISVMIVLGCSGTGSGYPSTTSPTFTPPPLPAFPPASPPPASPPVIPAPAPGPTPAHEPVPAPAPVPASPTPLPPEPASKPGILKVVSNLNIAAGPEHITDVSALTASSGKAYAYLGSFDRPFCSSNITGVYIVDITDPAKPIKAGFLPSPSGTMVGEGVIAKRIKTGFYDGDILVHTVEFCRGTTPRPPQSASPGIVLYDVSDPLAPRRLALNFSLGFEAHNIFVYQQEEKAYVLVTRDDAERDFYLVDITNPDSPLVVTVLGRPDWFGPDDQLELGAVPASFLHDGWVQSYPRNHPNPNYAGKTIAYLAYWDAGLILLDVTDPVNPVFLGDSNYLSPDPLTGQPPEGNAHITVPTEDGNLVFAGDEDFSVFRTIFTIDTGERAGKYEATEAGFTKRVNDLPGQILTGRVIFVGKACDAAAVPAPPGGAPGIEYIALIERGECSFEDKISNVAAKGYAGAIVFGSVEAPDELVEMGGNPEKGTIPAVFVSRLTAFTIMGISLESPLPVIGSTGQQVTIATVFDGWGYGRIFDVRNPKNIIELGQYATAEALKNPPPPGDHSMHNVIVKGRTAYISWYGDGIRVVDFLDPAKPREIAYFVDLDRGSDFWGVYLFQHPDGKTYILGSDRNTGLWIFEEP